MLSFRQFHEEIELTSEAANRAQQAAIAIAMQKAGKKPKGVAEGAPELLQKEMPLHRHAEKLLAQNGVTKDDPDYHKHLGNTINHLRKFGNIDLINKQGVAEETIEEGEGIVTPRKNIKAKPAPGTYAARLAAGEYEKYGYTKSGRRTAAAKRRDKEESEPFPVRNEEVEIDEATAYAQRGIKAPEGSRVATMVDRPFRLKYRKAQTGSPTRLATGDNLARNTNNLKWDIKHRLGIDAHGMQVGKDVASQYAKKPRLPEEVEQIDEIDRSQPSSSRGAEGLPLGKKAVPVKRKKVVSAALKVLQKQYKKVKEEVEIDEDWQKVNKSDRTDGLSQKAVNAYRRENPGSKLQTAVTEKNPKGKRAARRKSFCSRMSGMKRRLTSSENARDPDSPINKALRRWNC